jgi:exonuclease VII large subunit
MPAQMEAMSNAFEQMLETMRKAAEQNLKMQQEWLQRWSKQFGALPTPQGDWMDALRTMQHEWTTAMMEAIRRQRETFDKQYHAGLSAMEETFRTAEARDPAEYRQRCEDVCRRSIESFRQVAENGMSEFQTLVANWTNLFTKPRGA